MKHSLSLFVLFALTACASTTPEPGAPAQDAPQQAASTADAAPSPSALDQHRWLQRMVGEWTVETSAKMAPGAEPMRWESRETVRAVGGLWVMAEHTMGEGSQRFTSIMTLGYDARAESFVGTWVDSLQTKLWVYSGSLDEAQRVLTLEAEGPAMGDPNRDVLYRDAIEWVDDDHRRMRSSVQADDGSWTEFMTMDARRVR